MARLSEAYPQAAENRFSMGSNRPRVKGQHALAYG
jgi:hypothetical protein